MSNLSSTSLDSTIGLASMDLPPYNHDRGQSLAAQVTRSRALNHSNASSLSYDAPYSGHPTPDSSGAATPYTYQEKSALNSPADAHFPIGGLPQRYSTGYTNGSLPHILGRSTHDFDLHDLQAYTPSDVFDASYHSQPNTPQYSNYKSHDDSFGISQGDWLYPNGKP